MRPELLWEAPQGEQIVSMTEYRGRMYLATGKCLYLVRPDQDGDGVSVEPVQFTGEVEEP